jgi:hypothetical protein
MNRKVLLLSASFDRAKGTGAELAAAATRAALLDDPNAPSGAEQRSARWKVRSAYGDIGLRYREDETVAYVASRMPAIYAACHRVLREVATIRTRCFYRPYRAEFVYRAFGLRNHYIPNELVHDRFIPQI